MQDDAKVIKIRRDYKLHSNSFKENCHTLGGSMAELGKAVSFPLPFGAEIGRAHV